MQENNLLCVLEDIYTKAERTLIDAGRFEEVQQARNAFQETMEERFSRAVEELTGRRVVGFLSQVRADPDIATEILILEPDGKGNNYPCARGAGEDARPFDRRVYLAKEPFVALNLCVY
jgi:uncharacterized protein YbcI